ncbi:MULTISPECIES: hypothetical protein [unclassified Mesorhizobium]|uniref:hypothetical protein n=1 Tax=unclassified Mesorhizobium TaxID=325217 RepID=UPI00296236F9|nr:hypothetical protein [Mesorhizobium sp. CO1-1-7]
MWTIRHKEDQSVRQPGIVVDDSIEHRFIDAAGLFLDFRAADPDRLGVGEKLLNRLGN